MDQSDVVKGDEINPNPNLKRQKGRFFFEKSKFTDQIPLPSEKRVSKFAI